MIPDIIGYLALGFGLFAISKTQMISFRLWHIVSAICYITYGLCLSAYPVILGGLLFLLIHIYKLYKAKKAVQKTDAK